MYDERVQDEVQIMRKGRGMDNQGENTRTDCGVRRIEDGGVAMERGNSGVSRKGTWQMGHGGEQTAG